MYIKDPYICFDNKLSSSGGSSQRNTRTSHQFTRSKDETLKTKKYKRFCMWCTPWGWQLVVETYIGVFNIYYIRILCRSQWPRGLMRGSTAARLLGLWVRIPPRITLRHITLGRTPLDEWSARRIDLCLTTHNTHKRQTSMIPAVFEPTIPGSEQTQTHALDREATGIEIK
jgi:hypothetical protein